jgi:hypothetical protein
MKKSLAFLDELIKIEELRDAQWKKEMVKQNKSSQISGDSMMIYHLKNLRQLIEIEFAQNTVSGFPLP